MFNSRIIGLGHYVPENVVTNDDLSKLIDTSDSWIQERTGIKERRWIDPKSDDTTSTMAVKASKIAIKKSGLNKNDIDFIIFATLSPDMYFPGGGVRVQDMLDLPTIGALDVRNQCSGFVYAMSVADQFIKTGMYKNILVIGSENHSGLFTVDMSKLFRSSDYGKSIISANNEERQKLQKENVKLESELLSEEKVLSEQRKIL